MTVPGTIQQGEVFQIGIDQRIVYAALYRINTPVGLFDDRVACLIDDVGIVAGDAFQCVRTEPAIQTVVQHVADDSVVEIVASAILTERQQVGVILRIGRRSRILVEYQSQLFHIVRHCVTDAALHDVVALTRILDHRIGRPLQPLAGNDVTAIVYRVVCSFGIDAAHRINIVASAAHHRVEATC